MRHHGIRTIEAFSQPGSPYGSETQYVVPICLMQLGSLGSVLYHTTSMYSIATVGVQTNVLSVVQSSPITQPLVGPVQ